MQARRTRVHGRLPPSCVVAALLLLTSCASKPPTARIDRLVDSGKAETAVEVGESYLVEGELESPDDADMALWTSRAPRGGGRLPVAVPIAALSSGMLDMGPSSPLHWVCANEGKLKLAMRGRKTKKALPAATSVSLAPLDGAQASASVSLDDISISEEATMSAPMVGGEVLADEQHAVVVDGKRWFDLGAVNGAPIRAIDLSSIRCRANGNEVVECSTDGLRVVEIGPGDRAKYAGVRSLVCSNATGGFARAYGAAKHAVREQAAAPAYEYAIAQYRETGDLSFVETFLAEYPESPQAKMARNMVAERKLEAARGHDGKLNLAQLEDVATSYPGTSAGEEALALLEGALLARLIDPPSIVMMIEFLRGPAVRDDATLPWSYLDESVHAEDYRTRVRDAAIALMTEKQCVDVVRYCNRWVSNFPDDPDTPMIRKLARRAIKKKRKGWEWKKFAACADRCFKRCKQGQDEACYKDCMAGCNAKYGKKKR